MADSRMSFRSGWRCALLAGPLAGLLLAGCVPNAGPVRVAPTTTGDGPLAALGIRVLAQPPDLGASPERLLRQFLVACADPSQNFAAARQFLAPDDQQKWQPQAGVRIYDGDPDDLTLSRSGDSLTVTAPATAATIRRGDYELVSGGSSTSLTAKLVRVKGQWRFRDMPDGLLLASSLIFAYKPVDLYFLAPGQRRVVPDRVFLLAPRANLADAALHALLRGPSPMLAGAVRSAIPAGSRLRTPPALSGGELSVELVTGSSHVDRADVAAQVLWTATQLPEVSAVRLRIDGSAYTSGSVSLLRANPDALGYNPNVLTATAPAYYVAPGGASRNLLVSSAGRSWRLSADGLPLRHPAVAVDGSAVAALSCTAHQCRSLYVGPLRGTLFRADLRAAWPLTAPSWDSFDGGGAWTAEDSPAGPVVWRVPLQGPPAQVDAAALARDRVRVLRLSRDGTRVAVIADIAGRPRVLVGAVLRGSSGFRIDRFRPAAPSLVDAVDLDWADAGHLAVLAKSDPGQGSVTPYRIRVDGSEDPQPVLGTVPGGQPVSIAAAPAQSLLVATARQGGVGGTGVSTLQGQVWRPLVQVGFDPTYPG